MNTRTQRRKKGEFAYNPNLEWRSNAQQLMRCFVEIKDAPSLSASDKFGPRMWTGLHQLFAKYPVEPQSEEAHTAAEIFVVLLKNIPCQECQRHFAENLKNKTLVPQPIYEIAKRGNLSMNIFTWILHNHVNKQLSKRIFTWSEYVDKYQPLIKDIPEPFLEKYKKRGWI